MTNLRRQLAETWEELATSQAIVAQYKALQIALEGSLAEDARSLKRRVAAASAKQTPSPDSPTTISDTITDIDLLFSDEVIQKRFAEELAELKKRYIGIQAGKGKIERQNGMSGGLQDRIKNLDRQIKDRQDNAAKLFGATNDNVAPEVIERIINTTSELTSLTGVWNGRVYKTALWTNDMVVLLLLISMGILGSALNLLAVFFTNERDSLSFGEYPLRLAFGAVLAIVMFIVAKAGIPVLADTTKIGGNAPLNPYFISLLAVVSGLMSDRAMGTIRNVATTLLQSVGGGDFSQRYTRVALDDALTATNRKVEGLAQLLGTSVDETKKLFSGNDVVSPDRQKLISAYLGSTPRDLFSDMPAS